MIYIKPLDTRPDSRLVAALLPDGWSVMLELPTGRLEHVSNGNPKYARLPSYSDAKKLILELEEKPT